jgi:tetratricopeptide (TPR) repeat protein
VSSTTPIARVRFKLLCVSLSSFLLAAAEGERCLAEHAQQRYPEAAACYTALRVATQSVMPWAYLQGDVALARFEDPSGYWREASDYFPARLRLAEWLVAAGQADEADTLIEALLTAAPASARVQYLAGKRHHSVPHLAKAVELEPRYGQAHYELALLLRRSGRREEADRHFQQFRLHARTTVEIEDPLLHRVRALAQGAFDHLVAGKREEEAGRLTEAVARYRAAAQANPALVQAHVNLIAVHGKLGQFAEAAASFKQAGSGSPEAHYNYGLVLLGAYRRREAEAQFAQAVVLNPHYADALNNLGTLLQARGDTAEAESRLRAALAAQPRHGEANFNLARLLSAVRPSEAGPYFEAAIGLGNDRGPAYRYYYAQHYRKLGRMREAVLQAQAARDLAEHYGQKELAAYLGDLLRQWQ